MTIQIDKEFFLEHSTGYLNKALQESVATATALSMVSVNELNIDDMELATQLMAVVGQTPTLDIIFTSERGPLIYTVCPRNLFAIALDSVAQGGFLFLESLDDNVFDSFTTDMLLAMLLADPRFKCAVVWTGKEFNTLVYTHEHG